MDNIDETKRLENQAKQKGYLVSDELKDIDLPMRGQFLDAGCGSGLLARYLYEQSSRRDIIAVDLSELRLKQAENAARSLGQKIKFQTEDLEDLSFRDDSFDVVVCRYVMEHVRKPELILKELFRVLKPGGKLVIINFDGIVVNLYSRDQTLQNQLRHLAQSYPGDLYIARKLPTLLESTNFKEIRWSAECHSFDGHEREVEAGNTKDRFHFAQQFLQQTFGSAEQAQAFISRYFDAMKDPHTTLFYTKFVVQGSK